MRSPSLPCQRQQAQHPRPVPCRPNKAHMETEREEEGCSGSGLGQALWRRLLGPSQSQWQVAIPPLPCPHVPACPCPHIPPLTLSTCRSCSTCPWTNPKASFQLASQLALSHPRPNTQMLATQWLVPLSLQVKPLQTRGPSTCPWEKVPCRKERGTGAQGPPPLLLPTGRLWDRLSTRASRLVSRLRVSRQGMPFPALGKDGLLQPSGFEDLKREEGAAQEPGEIGGRARL